MTDREMLDAFLFRRDDQAFEALVERHGPMVLRICRNILADSHAADDAFQQTFLVLARKSHAIRRRDSLSAWLHGVATLSATRVQVRSRRRRLVESSGVEVAAMPDTSEEFDSNSVELRPMLHDEIEQLPSKLRNAIVVCYFEGLSYEAASQRLRVPLGTLKGRLARGKEVLRSRLARRGVTASVVVLLLLLTEEAPAMEPSLVETTVSSAKKIRDARKGPFFGPDPSDSRVGLFVVLALLVGLGVSITTLSAFARSRPGPAPLFIPSDSVVVAPDSGTCH